MKKEKPTYEELENQISELKGQNEFIRLNSAFQNQEKESRADELITANKELAFQKQEKSNRADELVIANKELAFQNYEKEKRADELIIANIELNKLLLLNNDKDRFIAILAHDLRSPFSSILGFLNLLVENIHKYNTDEIEERLILVNYSVQNAFNLLEDLIIWIQSQSGKLPFEPQKLNFKEICVGVLEILNPNAKAKNITINYVMDGEIIMTADINMIKTILRNLISNAIKFTNDGGLIDISANQTNSNTFVSIEDNGIGIGTDRLNKLFDIQHQALQMKKELV
jgi:signal transduction histidine kinase